MKSLAVHTRRVVGCAVMLVGLTPNFEHSTVQAEPHDFATLEQLQAELAKPESSHRARVELVVAWLRATTQRAVNGPLQEREVLWKEIAVVKSATRRAIAAPRGVLIDLQLALASLARADSFRSNGPPSQEALVDLRKRYRSAIAELLAVEMRIAEQLRLQYQATSRQRRESPWTTAELESLGRHLKVQIAQAYRRQAGCYALGSTDRVNALTLALEQVDKIVSLEQDELVVWQARVEQVICLRMLERFGEVRTRLERWQSMSPAAEITAQLTAAARQRKSIGQPPSIPAAAQLNASATHLREIGLTAKQLREADPAPSSADLAAYVAQLEEHLQKWPRQPSADTARWWLARQLMSQRRWRDAAEHLTAVDTASPHLGEAEHALAECYGQQLSEAGGDEERLAVAEAILAILPTIYERAVDPQHVATLLRYEGKSHEVLRQDPPALAAYDRWRKLCPDQGDAQEAYARLAGEGSDSKQWRESLRTWQSIEKRSRPGSDRWLRARQARMALLRKLGDKGQAEKLLKLTSILYPQFISDDDDAAQQ